MNTTLGIPLESFNLDEREFERCKVWSSIIKRYSIIDDEGSEVDLDNLETEFPNEKVDVDEFEDDSAEVSLEEEENENNPLNHSVMQMRSLRSTLINAQPRNGNNGKCAGIGCMEPLNEVDEGDDDFDMQDMLDQTIPILAERERKWKESGMLNILNTFDEEKIDRKVGNWLRINNSIQAANTTHSAQVQSPDDDDSLHSMDTARYVLSNRKPRSSNCCSTIKSYRLLQSKRDALREKYAFSEDELERALRRHISGARGRNNLKIKNDCVAEHKLQQGGESGLGMAKKRRKLFNKQRSSLYSSNRCCGSSSSSDENLDEKSYEQYLKQFLKRQRRRLPNTTATLLRTPMSKGTSSMPRSRSVSATLPRSSKFKRNQLLMLKPRKRASECRCFKEEKLCKFTEHLADTSTEEWLVENCDSPVKLNTTKQKNASESTEVKTTKTATKKKKIAKTDTQIKKVAEKTVIDKKSKESNDMSLLESSFERELQKAIELSKQTFEKEAKTLKGPCADLKTPNIKKSKLKRRTEKPKSQSDLKKMNCNDGHQIKTLAKHNVEIAEDKVSDSQLEPSEVAADLETASQTLSKQQRKILRNPYSMQIPTPCIEVDKISEKETKAPENPKEISITKQNKTVKRQSQVDFQQLPQLVNMSPSIIDDISPARLGLRPQPKSAKLKKIKKLTEKSHSATTIRNETFFSQSDKICNSTAVANDVIALKKQFSADSIKSSTSATEVTTKTNDDPDCTIVSSTTDDPRKLTNATYTTNSHASRDILLYTPHNRTLAPPHSYSDGVFNITEEHLSAVIGEKEARKFMKYYIGRRRFDANLSVYYRPPRQLGHNNSKDVHDDETDSDVDALEQIEHLGDLYVLFDK